MQFPGWTSAVHLCICYFTYCLSQPGIFLQDKPTPAHFPRAKPQPLQQSRATQPNYSLKSSFHCTFTFYTWSWTGAVGEENWFPIWITWTANSDVALAHRYGWKRPNAMWQMNGKLLTFRNSNNLFTWYLCVDEIRGILEKAIGPSDTLIKCQKIPEKKKRKSPYLQFKTEENVIWWSGRSYAFKNEVTWETNQETSTPF